MDSGCLWILVDCRGMNPGEPLWEPSFVTLKARIAKKELAQRQVSPFPSLRSISTLSGIISISPDGMVLSY